MVRCKMTVSIFILLLLAAISWGVRFRPLKGRPGFGVDHWYWLLCIEEVRKQRRLPARLPYFMLEIEEQWYPPLYSGLMSLFQSDLLEKQGGRISQLTDLLNGLLLFLSVLWASQSHFIAFVAGFSYVVAYLPLSYNHQLQPRGLANFLLSLTVLGLWFYVQKGSWVPWLAVLGLSTILLFLHKMTAQMWVIYLIGFGLWAGDWRIPSLIPCAVLLAILISKGFYIKVMRAHWDIVSFWHENIRYLGCHPYYESPRYRREAFVSTAVHQKGARNYIRKLLALFQYNVFIIFLPILIYHAQIHPLSNLEVFLWWWLGLTYVWAFLTAFVPFFKALGAGVYYLYHSFLPLFLLAALAIRTIPLHLQYGLVLLEGMGLFFSWILWKRYLRSLRSQKGGSGEDDLREVLNYLKELPKDGVFCIPFTLPDITAYWTRKKVFWGGHSFGFNKWLKPYFPVMRESVSEILRRESLNYVLFWNKYLNSLVDIGLRVGQDLRYVFGQGEYELYEIVK